jgi:hypothetical protein
MTASLKWARRLRLDLAVEIEQLESGLRKVIQKTPGGELDITDRVLAAQKIRFEQIEEMIAALGPTSLYD